MLLRDLSPKLLAAGTLSLTMVGLTATSAFAQGTAGDCSEEVKDLQRQVIALQRRATVGEVEVARLRQEISRLERELQAARGGTSQRPMVAPVEDIDPTPPPLRSGVEETTLEEETPEIAAPAIETSGPDSAGPGATSTGQEGTEASTSAEAPPNSAEEAEALGLYDDGYTLFHQKRYAEAEDRFRRFLTLYPQSELADNAQFWIGECHYARRDFTAALDAFSATVERYPDGNKVADALLKAGKTLEAMDRLDQARQTYHEVTDRFPGAAAAVIARERLAALQ